MESWQVSEETFFVLQDTLNIFLGSLLFVLGFCVFFEEIVGEFILSTLQAVLPPLVADLNYVECVSKGWILNNPCTKCCIVTLPFRSTRNFLLDDSDSF